ncbi:uncharacterized protein C8R40DRAFT_81482 [Lentinula edodes]|uniref:uncharacterized protein n=1 Tax=Lentinula edodes TaxID=5353 RepID=UPI001E8D89C1|nr:uncharacterized protein C8R40DRAFT_81482 [Lentinula edodes]KAH7876917.1 hypothetical protein C8R40DRAFT_81482 [Lentinula edodes]
MNNKRILTDISARKVSARGEEKLATTVVVIGTTKTLGNVPSYILRLAKTYDVCSNGSHAGVLLKRTPVRFRLPSLLLFRNFSSTTTPNLVILIVSLAALLDIGRHKLHWWVYHKP